MKKLLIFFIAFFLFLNLTFANTWPLSREKQWTIFFDSDSLLSKNVSVEKEILLFKTNSKDLINENPKYIWLDYIKNILKKKGISDSDINNRFVNNAKNIYSTMLYKFENSWYSYNSWSLEVTVQYTLKNNSNNIINDADVWFSALKNEYINDYYIRENTISYDKECDLNNEYKCKWFIDNLFVIYPENKYPKNLSISFWWKKIKTTDNYMIENISNNYDFTNDYSWSSAKNTFLVKKINSFKLSFLPNETKQLIIKYNVALGYIEGRDSSWYYYDFSPIFNWKDSSVKEVDIWVIWDKNHFLNSGLSYFFNNTWYRQEKNNINFVNVKDNIYIAKLYNVKKEQNMNWLQIGFNNIDDIISGQFCWLWALNNDFFCEWDNPIWITDDNWNSHYKTIKKSNNPQNIIIEYIDWSIKEYNIFDILK